MTAIGGHESGEGIGSRAVERRAVTLAQIGGEVVDPKAKMRIEERVAGLS